MTVIVNVCKQAIYSVIGQIDPYVQASLNKRQSSFAKCK